MAGMIDADKTMDELRAYADRKCANGHMDTANGILSAVNYISHNVTRVDAVEVVRCKDCIHWDSETGWCNQNSAFDEHDLDWNIYNDYDFCSYGERRTDG